MVTRKYPPSTSTHSTPCVANTSGWLWQRTEVVTKFFLSQSSIFRTVPGPIPKAIQNWLQIQKKTINICTKNTGLLSVCFLHCVKSNGMLDPKKCTYCKVIAISSPSESKWSIRIIFIFVIRWRSSLKILYKFLKFIYHICITQKLCNSFWDTATWLLN